jgi:two-component system nitrate/nitrite sensor histidine kinase NarX
MQMQNKTVPIFESQPSSFSWVREPTFTPPGQDGGMDVCVTQEFSAPRAGELRTLLVSFLESIIKSVNATAGVVRLLSPDGLTLELISSSGLSSELQEEAESFSELNCEVTDVAALGKTVHASDISECITRSNCRYANCRFQSLISVPLDSNSNESTLGFLTIFFDVPNKSVSKHVSTMVTFAQLMTASIEHTRVNRDLRRGERLAARQGIANDIHDSLAQTLIYSRTRVNLLGEAIRSGNQELAVKLTCDLDEALEIGQKSARKLITDFRSEMNSGGLLAALNEITKEFRERNNVILDYHNRLVDLELLLEYEIQIFHIIREALTNISRHSGATHARLFVDAKFGYLVFTIEDNGIGARAFSPLEGHYGMTIMRERAQRIGGRIKVESAEGLGTQIQLYFPEPTSEWSVVNE